MADIAAVFHWDYSTLKTMSLNQLSRWQKSAIARYNPYH